MHESYVAEWRAVSHLNASCRLVLATLAHQPSMSSLQALSQLVGEEPHVTEGALQGLSFVRVSADSAEFVSESFRKFAAAELIEMRTQVWDLLINRLVADPDSEESLRAARSDHSERRPLSSLVFRKDHRIEEIGDEVGKMIGVVVGEENMGDPMPVHAGPQEVRQRAWSKVQEYRMVGADEIA